MSGLIEELKRRNVFKVGTAYVVMAWLIAQAADVFLEPLGVPEWFIQSLLILLLVGFPVTLVLAWLYELTPEGIKKEKDVDRNESITRRTGQKLNLTIIAVLALAVGVLLFDRLRPKAEDTVPAADTVVTETSGQPSIAVLPFVNMSSDAEQEYFSDGISEEILNALAKVKELKVAGRTSSFAFKGQNQDLRQIGETLGVEHILEGSVRKSGDTVRITAQLIQAEDGFHLWSETYDRVLDDVFAIQDEIANAILEQMKSNLLDDVAQVVTESTTDPEVYNWYLMARQRMYSRSEPALLSAMDLLDQAIARDPEYAPAYAQRGILPLLLSERQYGTMPEDQSNSQARLYLEKALQLDPNNAEALAGMGLLLRGEWERIDESIDYLNRALAINPNLIDASNWLHSALQRKRRFAESLQILEQIFEKDPLYRPGFTNLAGSYRSYRRLDDVQRVMDRVRPFLQHDPFYIDLESDLMTAKGELAQATELAERAYALHPNNFQARRGLGLRLMNTAQWERVLEMGLHWQKIIALRSLGRTEEATLLAQQEASEDGDFNSLLGIYLSQQNFEAVVQFFEDRWGGIEGYFAEYSTERFDSMDTMLQIALASQKLEREEWFAHSMGLAAVKVQQNIEAGFRMGFMQVTHARYFALAGEYETAIDHLENAYEWGFFASGDLTSWPEFNVLAGDPRFEAVKVKMRDKVNLEREKLGLGPIEV